MKSRAALNGCVMLYLVMNLRTYIRHRRDSVMLWSKLNTLQKHSLIMVCCCLVTLQTSAQLHLFEFRKQFGFSRTNPHKVLVGAENRIQGGVQLNCENVFSLPSTSYHSAHTFIPVDLPLGIHSRVCESIFLIFKTEMSSSRAPALRMWDAKGLVLLSINRELFLWHCYPDTERTATAVIIFYS